VIERAGARINSFLGGDGPRLRCRRRPSCRRRTEKLPRGQGCRINAQSDVWRIGRGERLPLRTRALDATPPQGGHKRSRRLWSSLIRLPPSTCGDEHRPGYHPSGLAIFPLLLRQPRHLQAQLLELPQPFLHRLDAYPRQLHAPFPKSSASYCLAHGDRLHLPQQPAGGWCGVHSRRFCRAAS
jgi:hypothetical protein